MTLTLRASGFIMAGILALTASSCKKSDHNATVCRITGANMNGPGTHHRLQLTYDGDQLVRLLDSNGNIVTITLFTHTPDSIQAVLVYLTGIGSSTNTLLDQQGRVSAVIAPTNITFYTRNKYGVLLSSDNGMFATTYQFTAGDMVSAVSNSTTTYEYDYTRPASDADPLAFADFIKYGTHITTNKHQLEASSNTYNGGTNMTYAYEYDGDGKVTTVTETHDGVLYKTSDYTYTCN